MSDVESHPVVQIDVLNPSSVYVGDMDKYIAFILVIGNSYEPKAPIGNPMLQKAFVRSFVHVQYPQLFLNDESVAADPTSEIGDDVAAPRRHGKRVGNLKGWPRWRRE
jgi:hypothetical protein